MDLPSERPWFLPLSPATEMSEILRRFATMHCPSRGTKLANWEGYTKNHVAVLKWWELFVSLECNPWPRKKMRTSQLHFDQRSYTSVNEHGWTMEHEDGDIISDSYLQMLVFQPCLPHDKPGLIRSLPPIEPCAQVPWWGFAIRRNMGAMWNQRIKRIQRQSNRQSLGFWKKSVKLLKSLWSLRESV